MKIYNYLIFLIFLVISCDKRDSDPKIDFTPNLLGKWQAYEIYSTDGASQPTWKALPKEFAFYYEFFDDSVKTDFHGEGCNIGKYTFEKDIIIFTFPCISHSATVDSLTNELLILDTQNFEPLKYKYHKLTK
jgi:hypothetical protein